MAQSGPPGGRAAVPCSAGPRTLGKSFTAICLSDRHSDRVGGNSSVGSGQTSSTIGGAEVGPSPQFRSRSPNPWHRAKAQLKGFKNLSASKVTGTLSAPQGRLTEHVAPGLLRGVQTHKVLEQFGAMWDNKRHTCVETMTEDQERDFRLSEPVESLHDFISHDWATGRWGKVIALTHCYNSVPSVIISVLGCLSASLMILLGVLPRPPLVYSEQLFVGGPVDVPLTFFFQPLGFVLFAITFLFWQKANFLVRLRPRFAFVDKICINQCDEELKRRGILSLAGFLSLSDRLVMLWTTRYFTRLWCVYELATWLHIAGHDNFRRGIKFMPLSRALAFTVIQLSCFFHFWMLTVFRMLGIPGYAATLPCTFLASFPFIYGVRASFRDLLALPAQLSSFSIKEAACFCCSNGHRHPVTGELLPCDRKLIYRALQGWFSEASDGVSLDTEEKVLEYFDELVRGRVRRSIVARFGLIHVGFRQTMLMSLPAIFYELDCLFALSVQLPAAVVERQLVYSIMMCFFWWPVVLKLSIMFIHGVARIDMRFVQPSRRGPLIALLLAIVWTLLVGVLYVPVSAAAAVSSPVPLWSVMGALALLTGLLYGPAPSLPGSSELAAESAEVAPRTSKTPKGDDAAAATSLPFHQTSTVKHVGADGCDGSMDRRFGCVSQFDAGVGGAESWASFNTRCSGSRQCVVTSTLASTPEEEGDQDPAGAGRANEQTTLNPADHHRGFAQACPRFTQVEIVL